MMKQITSLEDFFNAPNVIQQIWVSQATGIPTSLSLYEKAITEHPEYFPDEDVEHRRVYATIPGEVHEKFFLELMQREGEIMKDQPYRQQGILFYATHPEETAEHDRYRDEKQPELDAMERELHQKYYGPYNLKLPVRLR